MTPTGTAYIRCLAKLYTFQRERGQPASLDVEIPEEGIAALALAQRIGLPLADIEGVFLNHRVAGTDAVVHAGDRLVFVPSGTPASHPSFFGPFVTRAESGR